MPMIVPILAGAASIAGGIGAAATLATGITAAGIMGGLMVAGGVLTIAGALTKNHKLMKWGGVISLVGGVGSLIAGGAEAATAELAKRASEEGMSNLATQPLAQSAAGEAGAVAGEGAGFADNPFQAVDDGANMGLAERASGGVLAQAPADVAQAGSFNESPFQAVDDGLVAKESVGLADNTAGAVAKSPVKELLDPSKTPAKEAFRTSEIAEMNKTGGSFWDKAREVSKWMKENKELTYAASGLIGGAMQSYGQQEAMKERLRLEEEALRRNQARYSGSVMNLRMPIYQPPPKKG